MDVLERGVCEETDDGRPAPDRVVVDRVLDDRALVFDPVDLDVLGAELRALVFPAIPLRLAAEAPCAPSATRATPDYCSNNQFQAPPERPLST